MHIEDIVKVTATVNLYAVALDSHRYDLFDRVFTQGAKTDFGGGAAFTGRDALKETFAAIHAPFHSTQHIISGHSVAVNGDQAWCVSYVHGYFTRVIDGAICVFDSTGWYDDQLVRHDDGWLIQDRISRMTTANGDHRVMQAMPGVDADFQLLSLGSEAEAGRVAYLRHV